MTPGPGTGHARGVFTCARNEGIWLLEWIAYHKAIGFDRIFVASNDCTDGSDLLLDRLAERGEVIHIRHDVPAGLSPQESGTRAALAHPDMQGVDWLLHVDCDEFLNITTGSGQIDDLLSLLSPADCIIISWRMFGANGRRLWPGGLVLEQCLHTEARIRPHRALQKSLFRPHRFRSAYAHMPKDPVAPDVVLRNTVDTVLSNRPLFKPEVTRHRRAAPADITWANACINHYAIRSEDVFLLKNLRGDGLGIAHQKYSLASRFRAYADRNDMEETSILRHLAAVHAHLARLRDDATTAALEAACHAEFTRLREEHLVQAGRFGWHDPRPAIVDDLTEETEDLSP